MGRHGNYPTEWDHDWIPTKTEEVRKCKWCTAFKYKDPRGMTFFSNEGDLDGHHWVYEKPHCNPPPLVILARKYQDAKRA